MNLTPHDVVNLRASVRGRTNEPDLHLDQPFIRFELDQTGVGGHWAVIQGGLVRARTPQAGVALHLLQGERLRPGFIAMVMDPKRDAEEALLNPQDQARRERERGRAIAQAAEEARLVLERRHSSLAEAQAAQRLRLTLEKGITLDDLLDPTTF